MARGRSVAYRLCDADNPMIQMTNIWTDTVFVAFGSDKSYIVQTNPLVVQRCMLMTTDPGDLVLDPTCGSGTTAYVAEQWGRRWITIDTSRVALALARARIMGARYPYYLLADSREGHQKEAEVTRSVPSEAPTRGDIRQGFVYERVPHITLKSIANNAEIDVIWEKFQETLEPLREQLNNALGKSWQEWEIPRETEDEWPTDAKEFHAKWRESRIERQKEIDASITAKADFEYLYDKPYSDNTRIRVAGPFTAESLSPHRVLAVDEQDELIDELEAAEGKRAAPDRSGDEADFASVMLEHLKTSGVQQAHKEDRIAFTSITGWPGNFICAEGLFMEGDPDRAGRRRIGVRLDPADLVQRPARWPVGPDIDAGVQLRPCIDAEFLDVIVAADGVIGAEDSRLHRPAKPGQIGLAPDVMMGIDEALWHVAGGPEPLVGNSVDHQADECGRGVVVEPACRHHEVVRRIDQDDVAASDRAPIAAARSLAAAVQPP